MHCDEVKDGLGEFVTRALEPEVQEAIDAHLASCPGCACELEVIASLEATLRDLGRVPRRERRAWPTLAAAASVAVVALCAWFLMREPPARLVSGSLRAESTAYDAPARLPYDSVLEVARAATIRLPGGERLELNAATTVVLDGPHELDLRAGALAARVGSGSQRIRIDTPLGRITTSDSHFGVVMEESDMSRGSVAAISGAVVTVAVISGFVIFDKGGAEAPVSVNTGEQVMVGGDEVGANPLDIAAQSARTRQQLDDLRGRVTQLEQEKAGLVEKSRKLEAQSASLAKENAELQQQVEKLSEGKAATVADVLALFSTLKKKGVSAIIMPGTTSKLVYDVRRLGDEGVKAMLELLRSEDDDDRFLATAVLEKLQDPRAFAHLKEAALSDKSELVANMSARALMLMDDPKVVPHLREIMEKGAFGARVNAAFGLVKHADEQGIAMTMKLIRGESEFLRGKIAEGLFMLNGDHVIPLIDELSRRSRDSDRTMTVIIDWYARQKTTAARTQLQNLVSDESLSPTLREQVLQALNQ